MLNAKWLLAMHLCFNISEVKFIAVIVKGFFKIIFCLGFFFSLLLEGSTFQVWTVAAYSVLISWWF